jgi:amino acid transporter
MRLKIVLMMNSLFMVQICLVFLQESKKHIKKENLKRSLLVHLVNNILYFIILLFQTYNYFLFIGSFIKLKDSSWIPAIENYLGFGTLSAFCVDNSEDGQVLNRIMKEVFQAERPPQVIISKFFYCVSNKLLR